MRPIFQQHLCNFNPRPPWGGRPVFEVLHQVVILYFNPRPPWGGRLCGAYFSTSDSLPFQSTPSVGRATFSDIRQSSSLRYFNPRPPWGGRPRLERGDTQPTIISIHALRGEGDRRCALKLARRQHFNPRPPWGGRRHTKYTHTKTGDFNPRPPWGGRRHTKYTHTKTGDFNPRPPWGGRPLIICITAER